jgi:hypothetical protein
MTRLETISRAIYEKRMSQVGIPGFEIVPWEKLPPMARAYALDVGQAAMDAEDFRATQRRVG